jgi:hypothetical protein
MNKKIESVAATDQEISFKEAARYAGIAISMKKAYEKADRTARTYSNIAGKKALKGLMDFADIATQGVEGLTQEGREIVLNEIESVYSKKLD